LEKEIDVQWEVEKLYAVEGMGRLMNSDGDAELCSLQPLAPMTQIKVWTDLLSWRRGWRRR